MQLESDLANISRDEINEAMARYLSEGGKIKKIKKVHNSISAIDPLADQDDKSLNEGSPLGRSLGVTLSFGGLW
ncbi:MAG: hypothetical protein HQM14_08900 [SAR324 cluster bacterium]|nr:hypothetical protein [SAR324 cluster bacterium]